MSREPFIYLAPYIFSLFLLVGIFVYALRHGFIRGARPFAWLMLGQILTILGFLLELLSSGLETKILWDTFQWLTAAGLVILPLLIFSYRFSEHTSRSRSLMLVVVLSLLALFATLLLTDRIHHLFYQHPRLSRDGPFLRLTYDFTPVLFLYLFLYGYGVYLYAIVLVTRHALRAENAFRLQDLTIVIGFLLPLLASLLTLANVQIAPQRDLTPVAMAVGSLLAAWGLFRYGLFDIAPMAREQVFEELIDPVIILDPRNRVVDINQAALDFLEQQPGIIRQTTELAFKTWPTLIDAIKNPFVQRKEISTTKNGRLYFFEISISHLLGEKRELIGRTILIRDITRLKTLETSYETLSKEVEQRIQERTKKLHHTAERYRTIVEHQTDFIVRWKPDGTRTFVNDAYCQYWGISQEQALARNFLFHASAEDRPNIEEKIARLDSGTAEVETEIYRMTRPDGSIIWHEWTDKAIRDEWGRLIEIQSTGRDVTERKQAQVPTAS